MTGVAGGAMMSHKRLGAAVSLPYLYWGAALVAAAVVGLIYLRAQAATRAVGVLRFSSLSIQLALIPIMLALCVPLLLEVGIDSRPGAVILGYFALVTGYQFFMTRRHFAQCWDTSGSKVLAEFHDPAGASIRIDGLMQALGVKVTLFLPSVLEKVVPVLLIAALVLGLNFRNAYPEESAIAIGISSLTLVATLFQWSYAPLLLAARLRQLERDGGRPIRAVDSLGGAAGRKRKAAQAK